jgi:hypothetical protein
MFKKIEKPAACEMPSVIHLLNARYVKPADIHRQLCEVYGEHTMGDSMVRRWVRHFNEGRENMHDDLRSGRPSVVNEDLVRAVEEKIQEKRWIRHFVTFPAFFTNFGHFFTKLFVINFVFGNCVHAGCRRCLRMNTKRNKQCGMLSRGVVKLHDNACPHSATTTQDLIVTLGWKQFNLPPYGPDLEPSDFHVFLHLKTFLGGRFHDEVKEAVNTWFATQGASFYDAGIQTLVPHYDKCPNNGGNYVEKLCKVCTSNGNINGSEINVFFFQ